MGVLRGTEVEDTILHRDTVHLEDKGHLLLEYRCFVHTGTKTTSQTIWRGAVAQAKSPYVPIARKDVLQQQEGAVQHGWSSQSRE